MFPRSATVIIAFLVLCNMSLFIAFYFTDQQSPAPYCVTPSKIPTPESHKNKATQRPYVPEEQQKVYISEEQQQYTSEEHQHEVYASEERQPYTSEEYEDILTQPPYLPEEHKDVATQPPNIPEEHKEIATQKPNISEEAQIAMNDTEVFVATLPYGYTLNTKGNIGFWRDALPSWEASTFNYFHTFIRETTTYVGMGEWVGPTLLFAAQRAKRLIGAEPDPRAYAVLAENIRLNPSLARKITTSKLCISDKAESVVMYGVGASGSFIGDIAQLNEQKEYKEKYSAFNWTSHCIPLYAFFDEYDALSDDMFVKIDTEGAEKIIIPSLYNFYSSFPFPHKPAMFISFHGVQGFEDKLDRVVDVVRLYKYFSIGSGANNVSDIKFQATAEFSKDLLIAQSWMDLFITDREKEEFVRV